MKLLFFGICLYIALFKVNVFAENHEVSKFIFEPINCEIFIVVIKYQLKLCFP